MTNVELAVSFPSMASEMIDLGECFARRLKLAVLNGPSATVSERLLGSFLLPVYSTRDINSKKQGGDCWSVHQRLIKAPGSYEKVEGFVDEKPAPQTSWRAVRQRHCAEGEDQAHEHCKKDGINCRFRSLVVTQAKVEGRKAELGKQANESVEGMVWSLKVEAGLGARMRFGLE